MNLAQEVLNMYEEELSRQELDDYTIMYKFVLKLKKSEEAITPSSKVVFLFTKYKFLYSGIVYKGRSVPSVFKEDKPFSIWLQNKSFVFAGYSSWSISKRTAEGFLVSNWGMVQRDIGKTLERNSMIGFLLKTIVKDALNISAFMNFLEDSKESFLVSLSGNFPMFGSEGEILVRNAKSKVLKIYNK